MAVATFSTADVQSRAQTVLRESPSHELHELRVEQRNGSLLISGVVTSFYHKQLAQEVVWAVCREASVELTNLIQVR